MPETCARPSFRRQLTRLQLPQASSCMRRSVTDNRGLQHQLCLRPRHWLIQSPADPIVTPFGGQAATASGRLLVAACLWATSPAPIPTSTDGWRRPLHA